MSLAGRARARQWPFIARGKSTGTRGRRVGLVVGVALGGRIVGEADGLEVGVALGVAVLVAVFQAAGGALTPELFTQGLPAAHWVGAASVAVGAVAATFLPRRSARPTA